VPMLAELVDAIIGVDTHRDTHEVDIAFTTGSPIASLLNQQHQRRLCTVTHLDR
jgi:hypothetical protein